MRQQSRRSESRITRLAALTLLGLGVLLLLILGTAPLLIGSL